jgi:plastocyanin
MKRFVPAFGLLLVALVLVACSGTAAAPSGPPKSVDPNAIQISSKDLKFSTDRLVAPAGKPFQIAYDNQEAAPHNVAIYTDESAATKVFAEDPFGGPKQVVYDVPAMEAGSYFFRCDVHPDMKGTLEVK